MQSKETFHVRLQDMAEHFKYLRLLHQWETIHCDLLRGCLYMELEYQIFLDLILIYCQTLSSARMTDWRALFTGIIPGEMRWHGYSVNSHSDVHQWFKTHKVKSLLHAHDNWFITLDEKSAPPFMAEGRAGVGSLTAKFRQLLLSLQTHRYIYSGYINNTHTHT